MSWHIRATSRTPATGPWNEFIASHLPDHVPDELFLDVEVVFHLAATARAVAGPDDADVYEAVNRHGAVEVARKARSFGVKRLVFMSSVKALGEPGAALVREDQESTATDPYGRSKHEAEVALLAMHGEEFQVAVLRPALVYGPGAKGNLEALLRLVRFGRRPPLPRLHNRRSLVGVNDLTSATVLAATHPAAPGRAYTVTDGLIYSTTDIIDALSGAAGVTRPAPFILPMAVWRAAAKAGDVGEQLIRRRLPYDSAALQRLTGNAEYEAKALGERAGYKPQESLYDLAESMIRSSTMV
jgi:nucleoside-diphosphate-sugar epimerase